MPPSSPTPAPLRRLCRSARVAVTFALSAALLAAVTLTAPAALARPADPGPTAPTPGTSIRQAHPGATLEFREGG